MPKRRSAPRKRNTNENRKEVRSARLSAVPQVANATKLAAVHLRIDHVRTLKNRISDYVHQGLPALIRSPPAFKAGYQQFSGTGVLNAGETQTLFHGIFGDYERAWDRRVQQRPFFVQAGWSADRYVRPVTRKVGGVIQLMYLPGAPKPGDFCLKRQQTDLTRASAYLLRVGDLATFDPEQVKDKALRAVMRRLQGAPEMWSRLSALVEARRARVLVRIKLQQYRTGTHTIHPEIGSSGLVVDESNRKYPTSSRSAKQIERRTATSTSRCLSTAKGLTRRHCVRTPHSCSRQTGARSTSF
ncbi:hypothetical protein H3V53_42380 [Paraburkholderia bengalensis]|uniref:Transposase n=1 Tax=Paraburkholderia bengalensis TaxID=2747562 RepID=A0ABU8J6T5_9BURK